MADEIATIQSLEVVLPVRQGARLVELRLRTMAEPARLVTEWPDAVGHTTARAQSEG